MSAPAPRRGGLAVGWVLALAAIVLFCLLGRWQLGRMHEKQAKLAAAAHALDKRVPQPLLLASDPKRGDAYDWAAGRGSMAGGTLWLDNQIHDGKPGVRMYCVLLPDDGVQAVLVDAGWWPLDARRDLPVFGCPASQDVAVRGLLAPPPSSGLASGDALAASGPQRWLATRLDLSAIAHAMTLSTGLAPRVLRLDPTRSKGDAGVMLAPGERDLDILPNTITPERHLGYAVQWFGLALTVFVIAIVLTLRSRKRQTQ
ncbi:SURF1 family protein [Thermomonas sp. HDW16]|uniref:SURF1 family protein n=1 Tax=Thermomonas sp. HDW16 TaxID=2714945 RepID=UPI00140BB273|nr:SURF1 family protein [Thermomonas sp. HDW16]QIL19659.1 SURF1 family protein [Thermomonas sp. HDW16]